MEKTITSLKSRTTKVAIIGDITALSQIVPSCLATHPSKVQACSSHNPNSSVPGHQVAEVAAAKKEGIPYINPSPWLCTKTCSPIIGTFIAYSDSDHITFTYASFLSTVLSAKVKLLL
jgi:hypothetical protein